RDARKRDRRERGVAVDRDPTSFFETWQEQAAQRWVLRDANRAADPQEAVEPDLLDTDRRSHHQITGDLLELAQRRQTDGRAGPDRDAAGAFAPRKVRDLVRRREHDRAIAGTTTAITTAK